MNLRLHTPDAATEPAEVDLVNATGPVELTDDERAVLVVFRSFRPLTVRQACEAMASAATRLRVRFH